VKEKDSAHWWIFKEFAGRRDNLVCAAVIARQAIIIKTLFSLPRSSVGAVSDALASRG